MISVVSQIVRDVCAPILSYLILWGLVLTCRYMYNLLMQLIIYGQLWLQRKNADTEISKRGIHSPVGYITEALTIFYVVTQMMN